MCFVTVRHEISGPSGLAVVEEQDIVYRGPSKEISEKEKSEEPEKPQWSRTVTPDETMLFRFSAITFNAHRIHYDLAYTREVEGYPGLIMNGGLTTLLLQELAISSTGRALKASASRNLKPMYANRPITLCGAASGGKARVWALDDRGEKAVQAELELGERA
jgi:3-methylfumaryl-CoA hydratase